jgi:hypothetical protein
VAKAIAVPCVFAFPDQELSGCGLSSRSSEVRIDAEGVESVCTN